jgi:methionyl-tRNA formyltransferase
MAPPHRILFLGSKALGLRVVQEMHALAPDALTGILTIDDRADSRSVFAEFQSWAAAAAAPLHVATNRKHAEQLVSEIRPDLCFVVGWYWLISPAALASVPAGFLGIHNSLLPRYRGGSPLVWAIIHGETEVGFSLFTFGAGMDDGPVWAVGKTPLGPDDTVADVLARLEVETVRVVRATYPRILDGTASPRAQDHTQATYCAQRYPADGVIDWSKPAAFVHNFVRAQSEPYPGAFTYLNGKKLTIWKARREPHVYHGTPGQIARLDPGGVTVVCGDDRALVLEQVEYDGTRTAANQVITTIKARFPRLPLGGE